MMDNPVWLLVTSAYAVLATWLICLLADTLGKRWGLMDYPSARKAHARPTPLVGGIALLVLIVPTMPVIGILFQPDDVGNKALAIIAFATFVSALIGITDDRHSLSAVSRLLLTIALFAGAIALESRFLIQTIDLGWVQNDYLLPDWLAWTFTITVLVGFINCVNMADGKNGLVIGMALSWALLLTAVGPEGLVIVMLPLVLMLCVLLIYNLQGRLFLGDGGAYGLAAFFGLVAVYSYNNARGALNADMLTLFFIVPGIDMIRLFVVRLAQRRSPMSADRDHFHHHLLRLFGWPRGLIYYAALIIVPSMVALSMPRYSGTSLALTLLTYFGTLAYARLVRPDVGTDSAASASRARLSSAAPTATPERPAPLSPGE
jgi:UDP-GlcNAc:undecaprenyl-phosphate/decaprenyl-phosphate GlcNAc-1-phosphate transferase